MLTNECCTLYLKSGEGFTRHFVPRCHWQESKAASVRQSGMESADGVTVYVFAADIDDELKTLLQARRFSAQDLIVCGECHFTFDDTTPQRASESLRALCAAYDVHTVMRVDKLLYGSAGMQHFAFFAR